MSDAALLVIDVQESFRHAPSWDEADLPEFLARLQALADGAVERGVPVAQVSHTEERGPCAPACGHVRTLSPLHVRADMEFRKRRHSALVGTGLDVWLTET